MYVGVEQQFLQIPLLVRHVIPGCALIWQMPVKNPSDSDSSTIIFFWCNVILNCLNHQNLDNSLL